MAVRDRMHAAKRSPGFTLIELMIVVLVIAILAAIAYPIYISQVRKARRTDATSLVLRAANREQQYYASQHKYTGNLQDLGLAAGNNSVVTDNKAYTVSASTNGDTQTFTITADAKGDQANDDCTQFKVTQTGKRTASDNDCW